MKSLITLILVFLIGFISIQSKAELNLGNRATSELKKFYQCRESIEGCSTEQEMQILILEGKTIDKSSLQTGLDLTKQNNEKSFFIPLSLNNQELLILAAATSLGVVAFNNDQEISDTIQKNQSVVANRLESVGNFLGTAYPAIAIAAGSYYLGVHYQDNKLKQAGLFIIGASVASVLVTMAAKEAFGRVRPNSDQGPNHFFKSGNKSFWSGHTAQVFTLATVISEMYKDDHPIVPYVAYGLASITMYARVHSDSHWASDVIIGAVAGHLITKLFLSAMKDDNDGRGGLQIYPSFDNITGTTIIVFEYRSKEKSRALSCSKIENEQQRVSACIAEVFELSSRNN